MVFPVEIDESIKRTELHKRVGGSTQAGMTTCLDKSAFLIFHDPTKNMHFGYDKWEGPQIDGTFWFTGSGVKGDQEFKRLNKGLLEANDLGKPIHFFFVENTIATYKGLVILDVVPYDWRIAPDVDGRERKVIVFHLVPILSSDLNSSEALNSSTVSFNVSEWNYAGEVSKPPSYSRKSQEVRNLAEMIFQNRFAAACKREGVGIAKISFTVSELRGALRPDYFMPERDLVVEAKPSVDRNAIRLAIGQVLDYALLHKMVGGTAKPAILLPKLPSQNLCDLILGNGILLIILSPDDKIEWFDSNPVESHFR